MQNLTYRTSDITRWGNGLGSDLPAAIIDLNFWYLFSAVSTLQANQVANVNIDYINVVNGNQLYVHLTNHAVEGPFTIPSLLWNPRGNWAAGNVYNPLDVVGENGDLYVINVPHTSGATFSPLATDGAGHFLYTLLLEQPANQIPTGGTIGQRLAKASGSPYSMVWVSELIRMALYIEGQPNPGELLLQYVVVDDMTLPAGLAGSVAYAQTPAQGNVSYALSKNGAAIGSINFVGATVNVSFPTDVTFVPGDVITLVAPSTPDAAQANISFTLVATLT